MLPNVLNFVICLLRSEEDEESESDDGKSVGRVTLELVPQISRS